MKTREEIEKLKENWHNDPNWDIETTEGFEDYFVELRIYRENCEAQWKEQAQKHHDKLASFYCPMSFSGDTNELCKVEKCAWWDSNFEKCLKILPAYFESCQKARSER